MPHAFTPSPPRRKTPESRPLADFIVGCIGPAIGRHGFGEADILLHWPEIVGAELSGRCQPLRLQWARKAPEGRAEPATLIVRVESASALALQHMSAMVVERVNTYFGWRCVGKIALRQGPLPPVQKRPARPLPPDADSTAESWRATAAVEDIALRAALARLGARALQRLPKK